MSDESSDQLSSGEAFINSGNNANQSILVVNDQGQVLFSNPNCQSKFNIYREKSITFDLEAGGIRIANEASADETPGLLIPYSTIDEMEYFGEHCFGLILDPSNTKVQSTDQSPENILDADYQNMPGAIYQALDDDHLTITQITNGIFSLLGYTPEDLVNNRTVSFSDLIYPGDLLKVKSSRQEALNLNNVYEIVYRIRHINGDYHTVRDQGRAAQSAVGQLQYMEGWLMPMTGERQVEEELAESEARYRHLIEASPDAVVYADNQGTIKMSNPQFARMLEIDENVDLVGTNILQFLDQHNNAHSEQEMIRNLIGKNAHKGNYLARTLSGKTIPIEVNIRSIDSPVGTRTGYIGIIRDMSEWQQAIQSIKTREAQYRAIVEDNPELIVRFTQDGVVTFSNQSYASFYNLTVDKLIGQKLLDVVPNQAKPTIQMILNYVSPKMEPATKDVTNEGPNHETRWYRWKTRAILDDKGELIEYQSVGEDITDEKNSRQAHQLSEQMIRGLLESIKLHRHHDGSHRKSDFC